jgi:hypothetical protein
VRLKELRQLKNQVTSTGIELATYDLRHYPMMTQPQTCFKHSVVFVSSFKQTSGSDTASEHAVHGETDWLVTLSYDTFTAMECSIIVFQANHFSHQTYLILSSILSN